MGNLKLLELKNLFVAEVTRGKAGRIIGESYLYKNDEEILEERSQAIKSVLEALDGISRPPCTLNPVDWDSAITTTKFPAMTMGRFY